MQAVIFMSEIRAYCEGMETAGLEVDTGEVMQTWPAPARDRALPQNKLNWTVCTEQCI